MQSGWTRRDLTAGFRSLLGSQTLVGCSTPNFPPLPRAGEVVDAHCHTFNGKDLPIVRFLTKVVIPENERDQAARALWREIEDPTVGEVVLELIVRGLLSNTPTAAQEADILDAGRGNRPATRLVHTGGDVPSYVGASAEIRQHGLRRWVQEDDRSLNSRRAKRWIYRRS
jgi:hypothetical protein